MSKDSLNDLIYWSGLFLVSLTVSFYGCRTESKLEKISHHQPKQELRLQRADVLGENLPEEFFTINGQKYFSRVDDKLVEEMYK